MFVLSRFLISQALESRVPSVSLVENNTRQTFLVLFGCRIWDVFYTIERTKASFIQQ
jgi:hypothetical protein